MDRVKILYCGYRDWSINIFENLKKKFSEVDFILNKNNEIVTTEKVNFILFIGWSWVVPSNIVKENICICAHPSPLPKYRGGSPIQNQIINGEIESAISLFIMNEKLDSGPIISQRSFSLLGELCDIIQNIQNTTYNSIVELIKNYLINKTIISYPQDESKKSFYRRRTEDMSEITISDIQNCTALELHNKIRALQDPYPNAFIQCKDAKLYLTKSRIYD